MVILTGRTTYSQVANQMIAEMREKEDDIQDEERNEEQVWENICDETDDDLNEPEEECNNKEEQGSNKENVKTINQDKTNIEGVFAKSKPKFTGHSIE